MPTCAPPRSKPPPPSLVVGAGDTVERRALDLQRAHVLRALLRRFFPLRSRREESFIPEPLASRE